MLADMSVGGQGAPLAPYLDKMLIEREERENWTRDDATEHRRDQ